MKGTFLRNARRRRRLVSVSVFLFVVAICGSALFLWRDQFAGALWYVLRPLVQVRNALESGESARLRGELEHAKAALADRDLLYQENLALKRQFGREGSPSTTLAAVLYRSPGVAYDSLVIDAGEETGVMEGSLVSAGGGVLVGRVTQVYSSVSRVTLFSSPGEMYEALLYRGENNVVPITLEGRGSGAFEARVPAGTHAQIGDAVVVPSIASTLVARVAQVQSEGSTSFETLYLRMPANPNELRFVELWQVPPVLPGASDTNSNI